MTPTSPNQELQRTAPCVTAPASAAAFPPAMQVPRRTPRSLSLGSLGPMRYIVVSAVTLLVFAPLMFGDAVPVSSPRPLAAIQDRGMVAEHARAAQRVESNIQPPVPADCVSQITEMVVHSSRRADRPAEFFGVSFTKQGRLAHLLAVFPRSGKRTPNEAGVGHDISSAEYDQKDRRLDLSPATTSSGPDGYELFGIDQLPLVCQELVPIVRLQHAFTANGLDYALKAGVIVADRGKHWAWKIGPDEEQMPNIIYGMTYQPTTNEIRVVPIEDAEIAKKVEQAVNQSGMILKWAKRT